ncbi:hypothetical protein ELG66_01500 [Rhizobium leguminosarum]|uniref:hypothetical protein n=1 Tax=Rhizobium leguminosarum TaxID=384 RepID=UPI00102F6B85|nr:hypothetical protein [Rhizobium leguminosarum]TBH34685.1 hypothetical protein ELG66_01500 [Rhizobium leguminosarum]
MEAKSMMQAAALGNSDVSRRSLLLGMAAASTAAAVAVAPTPARSASDSVAAPMGESPELVAAYDRFSEACAELKTAKANLDWLADEWRHRWPLAPEELLLNANADDNRHSTAGAERDIIGRFLLRDTSTVTKRLSREFREKTRQTCFTLLTSEKARELLDRWERHAPKGRTEKSLARNLAFREEAIKDCTRDIALAEQYEAETARLRAESGAAQALQRVKDADRKLNAAAAEVSFLPALTLEGVGMKATAASIGAHDLIRLVVLEDKSPLGQIARLVGSVLQVTRAQV